MDRFGLTDNPMGDSLIELVDRVLMDLSNSLIFELILEERESISKKNAIAKINLAKMGHFWGHFLSFLDIKAPNQKSAKIYLRIFTVAIN